MHKHTNILLLSLLLLTACSSTQPGRNSGPRASRELITFEEIHRSSASNAYDLIRYLRPTWLRGRGLRSLHYTQYSYPVVYLNENRYGDLQSLETIPTENISRIRFFTAAEATGKFGLDHAGGAILIII